MTLFDPPTAEPHEPPPVNSGETFALLSPAGRRHVLACADSCAPESVATLLDGRQLRAVVTDPPYSSGGLHATARRQPASAKYQHGSSAAAYDDFAGDRRDQRSWSIWCQTWLRRLRDLAPSGDTYAMVTTDWRQLPALSDAIQVAGWQWRGVCAWDKTESAMLPHAGYFRHQAEYVVWGTAGDLPVPQSKRPSSPGVFRQRVDRKKLHITQKPVEVARWLCALPEPREGSVILDPFAGAASIALGADAAGHESISVEQSPQIAAKALGRLLGAGWETE